MRAKARRTIGKTVWVLVWWNQQDEEWQVLPEDHAGVAGDVHIVPCLMRQGKKIARLDFGYHDFSLSRKCVCNPEVRVDGDRVSILHRQAVN